MNIKSKRKMALIAFVSAFGMTISVPPYAQQTESNVKDVQPGKAAVKSSSKATQAGHEVRVSKILGKAGRTASEMTSSGALR